MLFRIIEVHELEISLLTLLTTSLCATITKQILRDVFHFSVPVSMYLLILSQCKCSQSLDRLNYVDVACLHTCINWT